MIPKRHLFVETIAICAMLAFAVFALYRIVQNHGVIKNELVFTLSENFRSSALMRVPGGGSFTLILGVPTALQTNAWDFSGEIVIKQKTSIVWRAELKPATVIPSSWVNQQSLRGMIVQGEASRDLPLAPMQEYDISVTAINLAGCSLWLKRHTVGGDRSVLQIYQTTPAATPP